MSEHTPGPWVAINQPDAVEIRAPGDWVIAVTVAVGAPDAEDLANAQLIAAAPDLLGAGELLIHCIESGILQLRNGLVPSAVATATDATARMSAAIAKARGEQQ